VNTKKIDIIQISNSKPIEKENEESMTHLDAKTHIK
jgi:hypothetical protein